MSAVDKLIDYILNFSPEQLEKFLQNNVTKSILQPEEEAAPCQQEAS